jgi:hypothetical protein
MRTLLVTLLFAITATQALAINRYNIASKSCGEVKSILVREKAAILRYPSKRGNILYDRYVSNGRYCEGGKYARFTTVPARDNANCPVYYCRDFVHTR